MSSIFTSSFVKRCSSFNGVVFYLDCYFLVDSTSLHSYKDSISSSLVSLSSSFPNITFSLLLRPVYVSSKLRLHNHPFALRFSDHADSLVFESLRAQLKGVLSAFPDVASSFPSYPRARSRLKSLSSQLSLLINRFPHCLVFSPAGHTLSLDAQLQELFASVLGEGHFVNISLSPSPQPLVFSSLKRIDVDYFSIIDAKGSSIFLNTSPQQLSDFIAIANHLNSSGKATTSPYSKKSGGEGKGAGPSEGAASSVASPSGLPSYLEDKDGVSGRGHKQKNEVSFPFTGVFFPPIFPIEGEDKEGLSLNISPVETILDADYLGEGEKISFLNENEKEGGDPSPEEEEESEDNRGGDSSSSTSTSSNIDGPATG